MPCALLSVSVTEVRVPSELPGQLQSFILRCLVGYETSFYSGPVSNEMLFLLHIGRDGGFVKVFCLF